MRVAWLGAANAGVSGDQATLTPASSPLGGPRISFTRIAVRTPADCAGAARSALAAGGGRICCHLRDAGRDPLAQVLADRALHRSSQIGSGLLRQARRSEILSQHALRICLPRSSETGSSARGNFFAGPRRTGSDDDGFRRLGPVAVGLVARLAAARPVCCVGSSSGCSGTGRGDRRGSRVPRSTAAVRSAGSPAAAACRPPRETASISLRNGFSRRGELGGVGIPRASGARASFSRRGGTAGGRPPGAWHSLPALPARALVIFFKSGAASMNSTTKMSLHISKLPAPLPAARTGISVSDVIFTIRSRAASEERRFAVPACSPGFACRSGRVLLRGRLGHGRAGPGDRHPHPRVGLHVLEFVVVEQSQLARAERLGDRQGNLRLGGDDFCPIFLDVGDLPPARVPVRPPVAVRPWPGRRACRLRPGRPSAGRRCFRPRRCRRCRSTRFRKPFGPRAPGPRRSRKSARDFPARFCRNVVEPIAWTIPWPTRAMIGLFGRPADSCRMFVRTVTRARALSRMPSPATASSVPADRLGSGQSMTFG